MKITKRTQMKLMYKHLNVRILISNLGDFRKAENEPNEPKFMTSTDAAGRVTTSVYDFNGEFD